MNDSLRDRIIRHLEPLTDERGYQVLDYIEFLESKYAGSAAPSPKRVALAPVTGRSSRRRAATRGCACASTMIWRTGS